MAERQRMTTDEVVAKLLSEEHVDFVRESLDHLGERLGLCGRRRSREPDRGGRAVRVRVHVRG